MNAMALPTAIVDRGSNGLFDSTHGLSPEFALDVDWSRYVPGLDYVSRMARLLLFSQSVHAKRFFTEFHSTAVIVR